MATGSEIRVGDAEREAVASQLRDHYADGRLTLDELNQRLDQVFAAKTRADLNTVTRDLPVAPQPATGGRALQAVPRQRSRSGAGRSFGALAPLLAMFWLCLVLGGVFLFGIGGGRPIAVVLFLAALAFLRRMIFRRRGRGRCGRR